MILNYLGIFWINKATVTRLHGACGASLLIGRMWDSSTTLSRLGYKNKRKNSIPELNVISLEIRQIFDIFERNTSTE